MTLWHRVVTIFVFDDKETLKAKLGHFAAPPTLSTPAQYYSSNNGHIKLCTNSRYYNFRMLILSN